MDKKALEQEKEELNNLINKGVSFEVMDTAVQERKRFFGLIKKRKIVHLKRQFKIEEPTLGTLDRLSREWIEFAIDEEALKTDDGMKSARALAHNDAMRCAKVIALAVMGKDYLIPKMGRGGVVRYVEDNEQLEYLTSLFAREIKPSKLYQLCVLINAMCNLGDFVNSIRLMSAERTTMPNLMEQSNVG